MWYISRFCVFLLLFLLGARVSYGLPHEVYFTEVCFTNETSVKIEELKVLVESGEIKRIFPPKSGQICSLEPNSSYILDIEFDGSDLVNNNAVSIEKITFNYKGETLKYCFEEGTPRTMSFIFKEEKLDKDIKVSSNFDATSYD